MEPSSLVKLKHLVDHGVHQAHHETKTWSHQLSLDDDEVYRRLLDLIPTRQNDSPLKKPTVKLTKSSPTTTITQSDDPKKQPGLC